MTKYFILIAVGLLSGCTLFPPKTDKLTQLDAPKSLKHNGKRYSLKNNKDLDKVVRYAYYAKQENGSNWKSMVELLLDRNQGRLDLDERIELRENVYKNTGVEHFNLYEKDDFLYGFVIFSPSEKYNNWQIDVSKGRNIDDCGFVQYKYSLKIPKSKKLMNMGKVKLIGYLKKYAVDKELERMTAAPWQWKCVKQE